MDFKRDDISDICQTILNRFDESGSNFRSVKIPCWISGLSYGIERRYSSRSEMNLIIRIWSLYRFCMDFERRRSWAVERRKKTSMAKPIISSIREKPFVLRLFQGLLSFGSIVWKCPLQGSCHFSPRYLLGGKSIWLGLKC